jgi:hypothetical protein
MVHEMVHSGGDFSDTHPAQQPGSVAQLVRGRSGSLIKDLIWIFGTAFWTPRGTTMCAAEWSTI